MKGDPLSLITDVEVPVLSAELADSAGPGSVVVDRRSLGGELLSGSELDAIMERVRDQNLCLIGEGGVLNISKAFNACFHPGVDVPASPPLVVVIFRAIRRKSLRAESSSGKCPRVLDAFRI